MHLTINKQIGSGAFSQVYVADYKPHDDSPVVKVAVKKMITDHSSDMPHWLLREIQIASWVGRSRPESFPILHDVAYQNNSVSLVMELCDMPLCAIRSKSLDISQYKQYASDLLQAVAFLHEHSIVHRDIKSQNLLIHNGRLKVTDFGLSVVGNPLCFQEGKFCTDYVVTRWYRAPELLLNAKWGYTSKVDVWSIGIVLLEMACGYCPTPGYSSLTQIEAIYRSLGPPLIHEVDAFHPVLFPNIHPNLVSSDVQPRVARIRFYLGRFGVIKNLQVVLENILRYDPIGRMSAARALDTFFS